MKDMTPEEQQQQNEIQEYLIRKGLVTRSRTPEDKNNGVSKDPSYQKKKVADFIE